MSTFEVMKIFCILIILVVTQCINLSKLIEMYTQNGYTFNYMQITSVQLIFFFK